MIDQRTLESCWLQLSSGRGPVECQLAVCLLGREIARAGKAAGITVETMEAVGGQSRDALLSTLLKVDGVGAARFARSYAGTVQWICPSPVRVGHKRKNWFVAVDLLDVPEVGETKLDPRDVAFETMKAGGAGGQHVNKTESAVRATHRASGLVVVAREERSQHMNKRLALARLVGLLRDQAAGNQATAERERWAAHDKLERGAAVRTYVGPMFKEKK
ncbi:MAG: peptide chain release factor H [Hyphomicrobiaceae bacterium]